MYFQEKLYYTPLNAIPVPAQKVVVMINKLIVLY